MTNKHTGHQGNQNHNEISPSYPLGWNKKKREREKEKKREKKRERERKRENEHRLAGFCKNVKKLESSHTVDENHKVVWPL